MLWYERYRPTTLDDYVWTNPETRELLEKWIADPLGYPHLILAGTTGTGKTTMAKIIRSMVGTDSRFIPASLRSGVDTIRNEIVGFCESGGFDGVKIIILDEADRMSLDAQEMLRNVFDLYADDVRFIFTCNKPDKIIDPIKGRMWVVEITQLDEEQFTDRLAEIAQQEGFDLEQEANVECILEIVGSRYPNMRAAISELQRSANGPVLSRVVAAAASSDWEADMQDLIENTPTVDHIRSLVARIRPDDFENVYRFLYERSNIWGDFEGDAVVTIAEHLWKHSQAGLPDITLTACLIKLTELVE